MKLLKLLSSSFLLFLLTISASHAQFDPYSDVNFMATVGTGISGRGIPIFARLEKGIKENISVGGQISYQSYRDDLSVGYYRYNAIGISGRGAYHFNELLGLDDIWDVYAGATLGYYIFNSEYVGNGLVSDFTAANFGGLSIGTLVGGRYFINDKLALNGEVGGANIGYWGGNIGVTFFIK